MNWHWLSVKEVVALHNRVLERYGGSSGVLNAGALESTLSRPQNLAYYEPASTIFELAAAYGHGLVKNHCFLDGNKRTALTVMGVFLLGNGYELTAPEVEAVEVMVDLATGDLSQADLAVWLAKNLRALE